MWHSCRMSSTPAGGDRPSALRRLGTDLRHGRNLELYATVSVALAIAVLGVLNVVSTTAITAATLAVLALLAYSALLTRHQVDEVHEALDRLASSTTGEVPADRFLSPDHPALGGQVATATDIGLMGVTLTRTVRDLLSTLEQRLRAGATVRVMLIDVESNAGAEATARSKTAQNADFYRNRLAPTIDLLRVVAQSAPRPDALRLRLLPFVPTFGLCLIDPTQPHGRMYVEMYQHRTHRENPSFTLTARRDARWYGLFAEQFETLWDAGRELPLNAAE